MMIKSQKPPSGCTNLQPSTLNQILTLMLFQLNTSCEAENMPQVATTLATTNTPPYMCTLKHLLIYLLFMGNNYSGYHPHIHVQI